MTSRWRRSALILTAFLIPAIYAGSAAAEDTGVSDAVSDKEDVEEAPPFEYDVVGLESEPWEPDPGPELDLGPELDPEPDPDPEPEPDVSPDPRPDPSPDGSSDPDDAPGPEPEPDTGPETGLEPEPDPDVPDAPHQPDATDADPNLMVAITSVEPSTLSGDEDTLMVITGRDFEPTFTYRVGTAALSGVFVLGSVEASGTLFAGSLEEGLHDVTIINADGTMVGRLDGAVYVGDDPDGNTLQIQVISPQGTPMGRSTDLEIVGAGFEPGAVVAIAGREIAFSVVGGPDRIAGVVAGSHVTNAGTYDLVVTNPDGRSVTRTNGFTFFPATESDAGRCSASTGSGTGPGMALLLLLSLVRRRGRSC